MEKSGNSKKGITKSVKQSSAISEPVSFSPRKTRNTSRKHLKIEFEGAQEVQTEKPTAKKRAASKAIPIVKVASQNGSESNRDQEGSSKEKLLKWEPKHWVATLKNIRTMRKEIPAPVDTLGCDAFKNSGEEPRISRYLCLLSLMLSSQTKDEVNHAAMQRLTQTYKPLIPEKIVQVSDMELEDLIKPVSFYKTKTKHIKLASQLLIDEYNGDIPDTLEGLLKLPGVGKKMAHLCMKSAWDKITGIGVDVHVHRITNRLKWVQKETKTPEDTRVALESWLPYELWEEVNHMLVGFGQTVCTAINPKCDSCRNASICPSYGIGGGKSKAKKSSVK